MKKYKTFGELLAFIREHLDECEREDVRIAVVRVDSDDGKVFKTAIRTINTIYSVSLINGLVVSVEQMDSDRYCRSIVIKVLT